MSAQQKIEEANAKLEQLKREDEQVVRKQGWLYKQGGGKVRSNWKKRWFVLQLSSLAYYTDAKLKDCKGTIDIVADKTNRVAASDHKEHCFFVTRDNARTYFMVAKDDTERNDWIRAISDCFTIKTEQEQRQKSGQAGGQQSSRLSVASTAAIDAAAAAKSDDHSSSSSLSEASSSSSQSAADRFDASTVHYEGWLSKKGGGKKRANWQKRWFVLRLRRLSYYATQKKQNLKGIIPLEEATAMGPSSARLFGISISVPGRIYLMEAHSEPERATWVAALHECAKLLDEQKRQKLAPNIAKGPALNTQLAEAGAPPPSLSTPPPTSAGAPVPPPSLSSALATTATATPPPPSPSPSPSPAMPSTDDDNNNSDNKATSENIASSSSSSSKIPKEWDINDIVVWLNRFSVPQGAISSFEENELSGADILELTEAELCDDLELDSVVSKLVWPQIEQLRQLADAPLDPASYSPVATPLPEAAPSPVTWNNARVLEWLREIDCEAAIETFEQNALTGEDIFELTQAEVENELDLPDPETATRVWKQLHFLKLKHTPVQPGYDY